MKYYNTTIANFLVKKIKNKYFYVFYICVTNIIKVLYIHTVLKFAVDFCGNNFLVGKAVRQHLVFHNRMVVVSTSLYLVFELLLLATEKWQK